MNLCILSNNYDAIMFRKTIVFVSLDTARSFRKIATQFWLLNLNKRSVSWQKSLINVSLSLHNLKQRMLIKAH